MKQIDMNINTIYNEDNLITLSNMPDNFLDLVVTSPPYDRLRDYKGFPAYNLKRHRDTAKLLYRKLKDGGVIVWVVGDSTVDGSETGTSFRQALLFKKVGFRLHDTMIYESDKMPLNHNRYEQVFEYMFILSKGKPKAFNPILVKTNYFGTERKYNYGDLRGSNLEKNKAIRYRDETKQVKEQKIKGNIFKYNTGFIHTSSDPFAFEHPAIFPEKLAKDHILSWSNEGDLVYDPFMGSGTVAKVCIELKRNWIGSEISKDYIEIINKRIEKVQVNLF